jgi:signal transduction histidine kinase
VPAERADELGNLARGFNAMTASLERNREELSARTESLERSREELSRRSAELERSNRDLEDYASVASHDLQGPLVTISMYADLLGRRMRDSGNADSELAERITAAAQRMRTLVRDLLTYSRLGRGEMRAEEVALDDVVADALDNLAGPIEQRGADVVVEPLPVVLGDGGQLSQVVQNLVSNAVKFSDEATPVVRISAAVDGDRARVSVADNGIGIAPDHAERIFRPFHRLHSTDRYEGSGIGLAICERIVSQHGGRIWAESTPSEGSTFHFTVPLVSEPPAPPSPGPADAERLTQA